MTVICPFLFCDSIGQVFGPENSCHFRNRAQQYNCTIPSFFPFSQVDWKPSQVQLHLNISCPKHSMQIKSQTRSAVVDFLKPNRLLICTVWLALYSCSKAFFMIRQVMIPYALKHREIDLIQVVTQCAIHIVHLF